jgi:signal recognition particle receptor subunit beta
MVSVKILLGIGDDEDRQEIVSALGDVMVTSWPAALGGPSATRTIQFGRVEVGPDLSLHIYVIPAQRSAEYVCGILARDILGYALVANPARGESMLGVSHIAAILRNRSEAPFVVAVSRGLLSRADVLGGLGLSADTPLLEVTPRDRESVKQLLCELLQQVAARVQGQDAGRTRSAVAAGGEE